MGIKIKEKFYWLLWGLPALVILLTVIYPKAAFLILLGYKYSSCGITAVTDRAGRKQKKFYDFPL